MKTYLSVSFLALAAGAAEPSGALQALLPLQDEVAISSKQMVVRGDGDSMRFEAAVDFDPKLPEVASVALTIDLASVTQVSSQKAAGLVQPEWFHTRQIPQASFRSQSITPTAPGMFDVAGTLVIEGISRDVTVPVSLSQVGDTAAGSYMIQRLDFELGDGDRNDPVLVANDMQVRFKLAPGGVQPL